MEALTLHCGNNNINIHFITSYIFSQSLSNSGFQLGKYWSKQLLLSIWATAILIHPTSRSKSGNVDKLAKDPRINNEPIIHSVMVKA